MKNIPLKILHLYIGFSLLLFIMVQLFKCYEVNAPDWVFFYLNDFLTIPMVATVCLHVVWLLKKNNTFRLSLFTITSLVILYAVYFEYYLPQKSSAYTGDVWDAVCYALGGAVFYFLQKLP